MKMIVRRMFQWPAPFAIVAVVVATVGVFAVEPVQACERCWKTHNGKTACIRVEGYNSKWTKADNTADISLWNTATGGSDSRLIYKSFYNSSGSRDRWHCYSLSSFTTKPSHNRHPTLDMTGKVFVNNSIDSPVWLNLHQSKSRICLIMRRNDKGNNWLDAKNTDVWDIAHHTRDGSC